MKAGRSASVPTMAKPVVQDDDNLPPRVPTTLSELQRAITLLGSRQTLDLKRRPRAELIELLGEYPDQRTAAEWKRFLKRLRKDEIWAT